MSFIRRARELGFTLGDVRALVDLAAGGPDTCARARDVAEGHLIDVRQRIADLCRMERVLADAVKSCEQAPHAAAR